MKRTAKGWQGYSKVACKVLIMMTRMKMMMMKMLMMMMMMMMQIFKPASKHVPATFTGQQSRSCLYQDQGRAQKATN